MSEYWERAKDFIKNDKETVELTKELYDKLFNAPLTNLQIRAILDILKEKF